MFHPEVLPPTQVAVLSALARPATALGFHLAGGTALALQIGHRSSVDFDWFRPEPLPDPLGLAAELRAHGADVDVVSTEPGTLHAASGTVRLSFLHYRYPLLRPPVAWPERGLVLASLEDLAAMKIAAVAQRGLRRDFYDLVGLMRSGISLAEMLELYRRRFGVADVGHALTSLTWFEDADRDPSPVLGSPLAWPDVKETIRASVRDLVRRSSNP